MQTSKQANLVKIKLLLNLFFAGKLFPGSHEELIEYMASVGYKHIPGGHQAWGS